MKNDLRAPRSVTKILLLLALSTLALRVATLGSYDLFDNTEARYAEMGRSMSVSGDWVTPRTVSGEPFWGKPPLSIWMVATSISVFGPTSFAARLPSFICMILCAYLIWRLARASTTPETAARVLLILVTGTLFCVSAGAVMTDPALALATTLSCVSFWLAVMEGERGWRWGFFIGLALGLLAKGPIGPLLTLVPIFLWVALQGKWREMARRLPLVRGFGLTVILSFPWFGLAEHATPGFLRYFLIGEHWLRFTVPGWSGDLYGTAHSFPRGSVWGFALLAFFPWSLLLFPLLMRALRTISWAGGARKEAWWKRIDDLNSFLLIWALFPLVLFTVSRNVIWTYALPAVPALSLILGRGLDSIGSKRSGRPVWVLACFAPLGLLLAPVLLHSGMIPPPKCERDLVEAFQRERPTAASRLIYAYELPASASFYAGERLAVVAADFANLEELLAMPGRDGLAVKELEWLPRNVRKNLDVIGQFGRFVLLIENSDQLSFSRRESRDREGRCLSHKNQRS